MKIILLAGYRTPKPDEAPVGLSLEENGCTQLTNQIQTWRQTKFEVVVILAGAQADEQLRQCKELASIEIAFDTTPQPTLMTNVRAGMATTENAALIFPVELPFPGEQVCHFLKNEVAKAGFLTPHSILQAVDTQGAPCHMGFPLLITKTGNKLISEHDELSTLTDPLLSYLRIPVASAPTLASPA